MSEKSILITGCSSGIGRDAALTLHARGWRVFATARRPADIAALEQAGMTALFLDYADPGSSTKALETVLGATGGTLDALFNNGAFAIPGAVEDLPTDALRSVFEANFFGWHDLTRKVIPVMRAQGHGRIVNHSSVLGYVTMPWRGAYNASKFALEGLTDTLRIEMRDTPIHVVTLNTGPVTSRIRQNSIPHFERWIDWEASPRRTQYETRLLKRLYETRGPDPFELPPAAVTRALIRALEARRPRARYRITTPSSLMEAARRILSTRARDWLLAKGG
ncbi:SDR family NAD(P)-dependent oxidoreductase [Cognatishimia sp. F0-27]|uniref:SDR family NAD(P)-dependent oxidoreductase n=1 Tax=Cognatishimia sp. F0-27 TaxID=2816855 RepID=UPI001D0CBE81|nr:SDR family NAD(P)-dependent oxidoreductase [Cognatishimia sp. F0-27]MCC1494226.1 SDR family NAD(P)-dependent oxidoreductase [Cognatishimia sp. F0-27]